VYEKQNKYIHLVIGYNLNRIKQVSEGCFVCRSPFRDIRL